MVDTESTMMSEAGLSAEQVTKWLHQNPSFFKEYTLKNAELGVINEWLTEHGYVILCEGSSPTKKTMFLGPPSPSLRGEQRRGCSSRPTSPTSRAGGDDRLGEFNGGSQAQSQNNGRVATIGVGAYSKRQSSKCSLRTDFARAKSQSVFQTEDGSAGGATHPSLASRRSSLKEMRKYSSLPPNSINILSLIIESKVKLPRYASKHFEMKRELYRQDEKAFFLDIVKDIANDLDLRSLTKKITDNLSILLEAEAASLFIVEGTKGKQTLVSKVFDFPFGTNFVPSGNDPNSVQVAWGSGILGWVAETGETVNLELAYTDARYVEGVDRMLGQTTSSLLCMPIRSGGDGGVIIGVAQVVNKNPLVNHGLFSHEDERLLETYLQFVGIALTNGRVIEATCTEYERNRSLLEVVHDLFEEQTSLEHVISKIMHRAKNLLKCERTSVLLRDENCPPNEKMFSKIFELKSGRTGGGDAMPNLTSDNSDLYVSSETEMGTRLLAVAEHAVLRGELLNITQVLEVVEDEWGGSLKSLIASPIRNRHAQIIGVLLGVGSAAPVNSLRETLFTESDEQLFEAFSIFCGLGINNTLTYGELETAIARQKVALEVLSYHAAATSKEVQPLLDVEIESADTWGLTSLSFDDFSLDRDEMVLAVLRMFIDLGVVDTFKIDYPTLIRWLLTVQRNYRDVPYHNWRHAFNVAQVMFAILTSCEMKETFSELEVLAMFVSCLCHDLDHRGTNNSFQAKTGSAVALLYGNQNTMEQHHFNHAVMIINSEGHNIFSALEADDYSSVMNFLKQCILATDLSVYFQQRDEFFELVNTGSYSWERPDQRSVLRSMLMTASDLAASTKRWEVQKAVAQLVTAEFFAQGDQERVKFRTRPPASMDREREHELPQLQMRWISDICLPLYQSLTEMNPRFEPFREGAASNMGGWAALTQLRVTGEQTPL